MKVLFRQGLIQVPESFLRLTADKHVTLNAQPQMPLIATLAHGSANYIIYETQQVTPAWAGPFVAGENYWLYWDIGTNTGERSYGHTVVPPVFNTTPPTDPVVDQHWFDTSSIKMKVWNGTSWVEKIRLFAAKLQGNSSGGSSPTIMPPFVSMSVDPDTGLAFTGTQAGLFLTSKTAADAGMILYDVQNKPIKQSNGEFLTTSDTTIAGLNTATQVKPGSLVVTATAVSPIPAFSVVNFVEFNKIDVASSSASVIGTYGVVETDVVTGQVCNVAMEGVVRNPSWDWSGQPVNAPLYLGATGELTPTPPPIRVVIGNIIDANTVLIRTADAFVETLSVIATPERLGTVLITANPQQTTRLIVNMVGGANSYIEISGSYAADLNALAEIAIEGHQTPSVNGRYTVLRAATSVSNTIAYLSKELPLDVVVAGYARFSVLPRAVVQGDPNLNPLTTSQKQFLDTLDQIGPGIVGKDSSGNAVHKSIVAPPEGIVVLNASGSVDPGPQLQLANDLAAVEGLSTTGFAVRVGLDAWTTRLVTGTTGRVVVVNTDGMNGDATVDLAKIGSPITNQLVQITTDAYGRVVSSAPVSKTSLVDILEDFYVRTTGGILTGPLTLNADPVTPMQAASKHYVDYVVAGSSGPPNIIFQTDTSVTVNDPTPAQHGSITSTVDGTAVIQTTIDETRYNHKLTVKGITYPSADGTTGQLVQTNGTGQLSFWTASGAGINLGLPQSGSFSPGAVVLTQATPITSAVDSINYTLSKLVPAAPPAFPNSQQLSLSNVILSRMCAFTQTNNTLSGNKSVAGGTTVSTIRSASYDTSSITRVGPGNKGTLTLYKNSVASGSVSFNDSNNNGTYGDVVITNNVDYGTVTGQATGFWQSFDAKGLGSVSSGWNEVQLTSDQGGSTNAVVWYSDRSSPAAPTMQSQTMVYNQSKSPALVYSSSVPHLTAGSVFDVSFTLRNLSGDTYPQSDTFATGSANGPFAAPSNMTYSSASIPVPLPQSAYTASPTPPITASATIKTGSGVATGGPRYAVTNGYSSATLEIPQQSNILFMQRGVNIDEQSVPTTVGTGTQISSRVSSETGGDTPVFVVSSFDSTASLQPFEATVVGGKISHDQTNYTTYIPIGPDLSTGRSAAQYITFVCKRPTIGKFDIVITGKAAGLFVCVPGSLIDAAAGPTHGWMDASKSYMGAGLPGTGSSGNGSNGCAVGGTFVPDTVYTNKRTTITLGPVNSSDTPTNAIAIRIKLLPGQYITSISFEGATN